MFGSLFEALWMSVLVGGASYLLYNLSHEQGHADEHGNVKRLPRKNKETGKKQNRKTGNFALDKWLRFGGGYYGTVALVTLIISEIADTFSFLIDWQGMIEYFSNLGFHIIVDFFLNQISMFINAIIWPVGYLQEDNIFGLAIMVAVSYTAYRWAQGYALMQHHGSGD